LFHNGGLLLTACAVEVHYAMKNMFLLGRLLLGLAILACGIQQVIYASKGAGLGPPWTPEVGGLAVFAGILFLIASAGLVRAGRCA
jgi:hypothetical protein